MLIALYTKFIAGLLLLLLAGIAAAQWEEITARDRQRDAGTPAEDTDAEEFPQIRYQHD